MCYNRIIKSLRGEVKMAELSTIKKAFADRLTQKSFNRKWANRNVDNLVSFMYGYGVPYIFFQNDCFIVDNEESKQHLSKLGFDKIDLEEKVDDLKTFGEQFYLPRLNISVRFVSRKTWDSMQTALSILTIANGSLHLSQQRVVFLSTVRALNNSVK